MMRTRVKVKELNNLIKVYGISFSKKDAIEKVIGKDTEFFGFYVNGSCSFFYYEDILLPTLRFLQEKMILKKVVVDMGAIKFVIGGADIMRPGITRFDDGIEPGEGVVIVDENNGKALAVGIAQESTENMSKLEMGKVIKNVHYVGDEIWNIS
jgi:PUA-domain protein